MASVSKTPSLSVPEPDPQQNSTGKPRSPSWNKGTRVQSLLLDVIQDEDVAERDLLMNVLTYLHKKEQGKGDEAAKTFFAKKTTGELRKALVGKYMGVPLVVADAAPVVAPTTPTAPAPVEQKPVEAPTTPAPTTPTPTQVVVEQKPVQTTPQTQPATASPSPVQDDKKKATVGGFPQPTPRRSIVSMPPSSGAKPFSVKLRSPTNESFLIRCNSGETVTEFMHQATTQNKDIGRFPLATFALLGEDGVELSPDEILSESNYIKNALKNPSLAPIIILRNRANPGPSPKPGDRLSVNSPMTAQKVQVVPQQPVQPVNIVKPEMPPHSVSAPELVAKSTVGGGLVMNLQRQVSQTIAAVEQRRALNRGQALKTLSMLIKEFDVQFILPGGQTRVINCNIDVPISIIKETIKTKVGKLLPKPLDNYVLKTPSEGYLNDESTSLGAVPYIKKCRQESTIPRIIVSEKAGNLNKKEKLINVQIGSLLGSPLTWTQDDNEISQFRNSMTWVRYQLQQDKEKVKEAPKEVNNTNSPSRIDSSMKSISTTSMGSFLQTGSPSSGKIMIKMRFPLLQSTGKTETTVVATGKETAAQFTETMFTKYYAKIVPDKKHTDFVLKVTGLAEFLEGEQLIENFDYIKNTLAAGKKVELTLDTKVDEDNDLYVEDFPAPEFMDDPIVHYDHAEIAYENKPWDQLSTISIYEMNRPFRLKLVGLENLKLPILEENVHSPTLHVTAGLYHGGEPIVAQMTSSKIDARHVSPRWYEWMLSTIHLANIPRATRICITLYLNYYKKDEFVEVPLGWANCQIANYKHQLQMGLMSLNLWPDDKANPIGTCVGYTNPNGPAVQLFVEFDTYHSPVVFPTVGNLSKDIQKDIRPVTTKITGKLSKLVGVQDVLTTVDKLIATDPLYTLNMDEQKTVWEERKYLKTKPLALPKLIQAVNYSDRSQVATLHKMLLKWPLIPPVIALELLDSKYADAKVRQYAVKCLEQFSDDELSDYLLQLIQVLKYELYHDSDLARFLLRRCLMNRRLGHSFFWYLKSEMHVQEISERYGLLIEAYLRGCGSHRAELQKQLTALREFARVANHIKDLKDADRKGVLQTELAMLPFKEKLQLPLNPSIEINGIVVEKCRYMDSKKLPLWLVFKNADPNGKTKSVIFKSGDDLRQDMLTLQMIRLMDKLWKAENLNLQLNPYGCIATGNEQGMIEVVMDSETMASIVRNAGGATAAFKNDPLANWIKANNPNDEQRAVENFIYSCAGYCVATYVLGIGDRHNDNIMVTKSGHLFHIDFGHFLGNFKKKFGFKRERAPFVFTPDFAFVMGGKDSEKFNRFIDICCTAYCILRKHAHVFITLFMMMLSTGIPELKSVDDITYLREAFSLDLTEAQARDKFKALIFESMATRTTQFNNAIHIWAH